MPSILPKILAVATLIGGFAATGDLRRLADRGTRLLNASGVPQPAPRPDEPGAAAQSSPHTPIGTASAAPRLPPASPRSLDLATFRPGNRLTIWVGSPPAPFFFDVIDPASGEVIERTGNGAQAAPRRLLIAGDRGRPGQVSVGTMIRLTPVGIAAGHEETIGPVRALAVQ